MPDDLMVTRWNRRDLLGRSDSCFESVGFRASCVRTLRTEETVLTGIWQ